MPQAKRDQDGYILTQLVVSSTKIICSDNSGALEKEENVCFEGCSVATEPTYKPVDPFVSKETFLKLLGPGVYEKVVLDLAVSCGTSST